MEARHQEIDNLIKQAHNSSSGAETLICDALKLVLLDLINITRSHAESESNARIELQRRLGCTIDGPAFDPNSIKQSQP